MKTEKSVLSEPHMLTFIIAQSPREKMQFATLAWA